MINLTCFSKPREAGCRARFAKPRAAACVAALCVLFGAMRAPAEFRYEVPGSLCWTYSYYPSALAYPRTYYDWELRLVAPDATTTTITTWADGQTGPGRSTIASPQKGTYKVICHGTRNATVPGDHSWPANVDEVMEQFDCTGNAILGTIDEPMTIDGKEVDTVNAQIANANTVTINNLKDTPGRKGLIVDGTVNINNSKITNCAFTKAVGFTSTGIVNIKDSTLVGNSFDHMATVSLQGVISQMDDYKIGSLNTFTDIRAANISIKASAFGDWFNLSASNSLELVGNDFYMGGILSAPPVFKLKDNMFEKGLDVNCGLAVAPVIDGNSFYSDTAFRNAPVSTAGNYWGGYAGCANLAPDGPNGWLSFYGVWSAWGAQETNFLRFEKGRSTPLNPKRVVPSPVLWARRIGQNALFDQSPAVRMGRPILFCFDVRVAAAKLDGVTFKLKCNGKEYRPTSGSVKTLRRSYFGHGINNSVNFMVPPSDDPSLSYELICDTTTVADDYFGKNTYTLDGGTITQKGYFARPLRVGYMNVNLPGKPVSAEEAKTVADRLRDDLTAMWPLREKEIVMVPMGPLDSDQSINFDGGICSIIYDTYLLNILATAISNLHGIYNYGNANPVDMIVGVVPGGTLGAGNQGVNLRFRRTVALVEAGQGVAALHELGHGLVGLCTWTEQYEEAHGVRDGFHYVNGSGAEMRDTVAFNPSTRSSNGIAGGHAMHFPEVGYFGGFYFDFMGAGANSWILPVNLQHVHNALYSLLGETAHDPTLPSPAPDGAPSNMARSNVPVPPDSGLPYRIVFDGLLKLQTDAEGGRYVLIPESFRARCMNGVPWPEGTTGLGTASWVQVLDGAGAYIPPQTPDDTYLANGWYNIGRWDSFAGDYLPFSTTIGLPSTAQPAAYSLFKGPVYKARSGLTNTLAATRITGAGGISDLVHLEWTTSGAVSDGAIMPLSHTLQYSADGGTTWKYFTIPAAGTRKDISAIYLPTGVPLVFRLLTTDGFSIVASTASVPALTAAASASVLITEPCTGDTGPADTLWDLAADVADSATQVRWTSDRDGILGDGAMLGDIPLSAGTHILTCTATLTTSATVSDSITVTAGGQADLRLRAGDLTFHALGIDPVRADGGWQVGRDNSLDLKVRNSGTAAFWTLRMYVTPPNGIESLVGEQTLDLAPFQNYRWSVVYQPSVRGTHHIRAEAIPEDTVPAVDADLSNNTVTIDAGDAAPAAWNQLVIVPAGTATGVMLEGNDPNDDPLTFAVTTPPAHGTLSGSAPNLTYHPNPGYNGPDQLRFVVNDGATASAPANVVLRVGSYVDAAAGELPCVTVPGELSVGKGEPWALNLTTFPPADSVQVASLPPGIVLSSDGKSLQGSPSTAGDFTATFRATNQYGQGPVKTTLIHVTLAPSYSIEQPTGLALVDGDSTVDFGDTGMGYHKDLVFTVRNTGTGTLTGWAIGKDGTNADDFTVITTGMDGSLAAGASTTFTVRFAPNLATGTRSAAIHVANSNSGESPFDITLTGNPVTVPEIVVEQPAGVGLTTGAALAFDNVPVGSAVEREFVVRNTGFGDLTGLVVSLQGPNAGEFGIRTSGMDTTVPFGHNTRFRIAFQPSSAGSKSATLQIASNDPDESLFDITLTAAGIGTPEIAVQQPAGTDLKDGVSSKSFGSVALESTVTKTFTIRNTGTANLTNLAVTKTGTHAKNFTVKPPLKSSLASGASTTFKVTFKPSAKGNRKAVIHIKSNDGNENPFDIALTGKGVTKKKAAPSAARLPSRPHHNVRQSISKVQLADGGTYLTLTVMKSPKIAGFTPVVEVSPNLIDWFSGKRHTTILTDDASLLKVRDNTPLTPGTKRYIHLKTIPH